MGISFLLTRRKCLWFFTCRGNNALSMLTAFFTFLLDRALLACSGISLFKTSSAFLFTPRDKPALNPPKVLLGSFKGLCIFKDLGDPLLTCRSSTLDHLSPVEVASDFLPACFFLFLRQTMREGKTTCLFMLFGSAT